MSEPAATLIDSRIFHAFEAFRYCANAKYDEDSVIADFHVSDPREYGVDFDALEKITDMERTCCISYTILSDGQRILTVTMQDEMIAYNHEGDVTQHKIAKHCWIVDLASAPRASPLHSHHQITWDVARGGEISYFVHDIPATSYLGMRTTTTKDILKLVKEVPFLWETPLNWSTVQ